MNRIFSLLTVLFALSLSAFAADNLTLDVTAGSLARQVGASTDAKSMKLTGTIDVRDLDFIGEKMTALTDLDLSEASIVAYKGERKLTGQREFSANELPSLTFAGLKLTTIVLPKSLTMIGDGALAGSNITTIRIPGFTTRIGAGAFASCAKLKSAYVPRSVEKLGSAIFRDCKNLTDVEYEAFVIGDRGFAGCTSLTNVKLSEYFNTIGDYAFADCTSLSTLDLSNRPVKSIGSHAFRNTGFKELDFSQATSWITIGDWAFADCKSLKTLSLPENVTSVGVGAFFNDDSLEEMSVLNGITTLPDATFKGASKVNNNVVLGDRVVRIGRYSFYGASSVSSIEFPGTLAVIGDRAFAGCYALAEMNAPKLYTVPELGEEVWGDLVKSEIELGVPDEAIPLFEAAPVWQEFKIRKAGIDDIMADGDDEGEEFSVSARFEGMTLLLEAQTPMTCVELYDTLGRNLATVNCDDTAIGIDTSRWNVSVFIVRVIAGNSVASVKIARR